MSAARAALSLARRVPFKPVRIAPRTFSTVTVRREKYDPKPGEPEGKIIPFDQIKTEQDLLPPGAEPGTVPTDLDQSTGLERLEILGKMQGIDIFDMSPLPSDRVGTFENPIVVKSAGDEIQAGCTGCPADSHLVRWLVLSRARPFERCNECGSVYRMDYVGPPDDPHDHHHHGGFEEPKTMADYVKPDYWYR
ncbi:cytochrome c oxidase subunit 5b [Capronia coronata CBS 617.96]|uniref:Cytochrome c oxidase subunit 4, mitochondrial n=1 Tax=Capronia coronata CBS 617.96 TaxID=1182541 RepID=W9Y2C8_9EURO|nr:cytochrome c oxidase subunit 5b [Capronia coronata CBS 617.96]EXJ83361.1 cytochrome c oxidase subunit 5b [Capronia coronata CBS 617.96]